MNVSFIIYCDVISLTLDIDFFSHQILLFFLIMMVVVGMLFGMDKKNIEHHLVDDLLNCLAAVFEKSE